jgi:EpsI family protein
LSTAHGNIGVRRLITSLGPRNEPVTYWLTVGDQIVRNRWEKRLAEIRLGVTGQIPDGMLFRISSIDTDEGRAFDMQRSFTVDLMSAVSPRARRQLGGLEAVGAPG